MRGLVFVAACLALAACGPEKSEANLDSGTKTPAVDPLATSIWRLISPGTQEAPDAPSQDALPTPPERSLGVYARGGELDPNDLAALARTTGACGGPWSRDFLNEPLALQNGRAIRDGNLLTIGEGRFDNPFAQLSGSFGPRDMDAWEFHYFGTYADTGLDLVHVQYSEGNGYILLDRATLTAVEFLSLPLPSPSGKYFVATTIDESMFVGIEIAERTEDGLKMAATFESNRFPCGLVWQSDTAATFRELGPDVTPSANAPWREETRASFRDARLELQDGKWTYLPAK